MNRYRKEARDMSGELTKINEQIVKGTTQEPMRILSLGAGVQSSTLLYMAIQGDLEGIDATPDHMIFADTGDEPDAVYRHLEMLIKISEGKIPLHIVSAGDITTDVINSLCDRGKTKSPHVGQPPFFVVGTDDGAHGKLWRKCTSEYKLDPIFKKTRELFGKKKGDHMPRKVVVQQLLGISLDEVQRMKPSRDKWSETRWPLIEMSMTRHDCKLWCERNGFSVPPRSACRICPFRSNNEWREMKLNAPKDFDKACTFDENLRLGDKRLPGVDGVAYIHRSGTPLREVDLSIDFDNGQLHLWKGECEGICGV